MNAYSICLPHPSKLMCGYAPVRFSLSICSAADRVSILKALSSSVSLGPDVDLDAVGNSPKVSGRMVPNVVHRLMCCIMHRALLSRQPDDVSTFYCTHTSSRP